ncbi:hypothetical protein [Sodalis sp. dw_96]|uniref:hypothetical protein n=1 Tax=Sodalis sp. dw_96 TaxID=2719794 RepID=UPI001BD48444|nr:hypothetical protein [Sodalis sp. dw_96]
MEELTKETMLYKDYRWTHKPSDDPQNREIDVTKIDRHEGYEVLPYINKWTLSSGNESTLEDRLYIEWIIREKLPIITVLRKETTDFIISAYPYNRAEFKKSKVYLAYKPKRQE